MCIKELVEAIFLIRLPPMALDLSASVPVGGTLIMVHKSLANRMILLNIDS